MKMSRHSVPVARAAKFCLSLAPFLFSAVLRSQTLTCATELEEVAVEPMTVAEALQANFTRPIVVASRSRRPQVVEFDTTASSYLIPGAGSIHGNGGTYFHSDVTIANYRNASQRIAVGWLQQNVASGSSPVHVYNIPANTTVNYDDFVGSSLGESGLGSIVVLGQTASGANDSSALLDGNSRIWTNQPNASGTVSLGFAPVSIADSVGSSTAIALALRQDAGYRCNVGIVNLDSVAHTWTVYVVYAGGSQSFEVQVPAYSMNQVALPAGNFGHLFVEFQPPANAFVWSAYGVSVDQITGDGWVTHALQP
jgi:hypothetical protein